MIETAVTLPPLEASLEYVRHGYAVVPLLPRSKRPAVAGWPKLRLTEADLGAFFTENSNIGLILGDASEGLVDVDLDTEDAVAIAERFLPVTAVTGREGRPRSHWWFRCPGIASRRFDDPLTHECILELRSTGAQTVVGPSVHPDGGHYDVLRGEPLEIDPDTLLQHLQALFNAILRARGHESVPIERLASEPRPTPTDLSSRVIDDSVGNLRRASRYLEKMAPGISGQGGHNPTYAAATAIVHGFCLSPDAAFDLLKDEYNPRCEPPWDDKHLWHKVEDAWSKPHMLPYGWLRDTPRTSPAPARPAPSTSESSVSGLPVTRERRQGPIDPGPLPPELCAVPGFIDQVMSATLASASYPNRVIALSGAISLQAMLAGRKVMDPGDSRTNLYVLSLAHSGTGKDAARKMNVAVLREAGLVDALAQQLSSGEGLQDALKETPSMLVQTDEIDTMLQSIRVDKDGRFESLMAMLLSVYSASNSVLPLRRLARHGKPGHIEQPSLVIFGTAIPCHFYQALTTRLLTNGFFARMLVLEAEARGAGQDASAVRPPPEVIETARWWANQPSANEGSGGAPRLVPRTDDANAYLSAFREKCDREYDEAESGDDPIATAVWARVHEMACKLSLIYAVSQNHRNPVIMLEAARWACQLAEHQARRMLFMAGDHAAESVFDAKLQAIVRCLRQSPNGAMGHSALLKKSRVTATFFRELIDTLDQRGDILVESADTSGRPRVTYHLVEAGNEGEGSGNEGGEEPVS
ncbi:MAG: bifunctional DNA primase/polymerase [Phycisphaerales bacterium]